MSSVRRRRTLVLAATAAYAALTSWVVQAQPDDLAEVCTGERLPFVAPPFDAFDSNGDERLGEGEAADCSALAAVFTRLDLDADQTLSRAEYRGFADVWRRRKRAFDADAE